MKFRLSIRFASYFNLIPHEWRFLNRFNVYEYGFRWFGIEISNWNDEWRKNSRVYNK